MKNIAALNVNKISKNCKALDQLHFERVFLILKSQAAICQTGRTENIKNKLTENFKTKSKGKITFEI